MRQSYLYQIFYNEETMGMVDEGFIPMNNMANLRPDWREYWSIRHYLLSQKIDLDAYYGFFSPKFCEKTNLKSEDVQEFLKNQTADVVSFSPYFDQISFFPNPFIQGEINHPGLMSSSQRFFDLANISIDVKNLVADQRSVVFCNFFVAKGNFWLTWLAYCEKLFSLCEDNSSQLAKELNSLVKYKPNEDVAMKVFLIERMVTVILNVESYSSACINNLVLPYAGAFLLPHHRKMVHCEALKQAYLNTGNHMYLDFFHEEACDISNSVKNQVELHNSIK
jgi:hypothetical protein